MLEHIFTIFGSRVGYATTCIKYSWALRRGQKLENVSYRARSGPRMKVILTWNICYFALSLIIYRVVLNIFKNSYRSCRVGINAKNESFGLYGRFYIILRPSLQQKRYARTRRNIIMSVKSKQKVTLDQRDASKQWA